MAQLGSPGVAVSVIDESFYTPAAPGTTPLIIVATAENKANGAGTGTAPGTLKANAGKVYLLTSQMDLGTTFGTPYFETDASNNPVHAGERNEYGLQAAYSYLGVSSRAYVVRADVDLGALEPVSTEPKGAPADGTYWLDTADSLFGVFEWTANGQTFVNKIPSIITDTAYLDNMGAPVAGFGATGNYALVVTETPYKLFYKKGVTSTPAGWVAVGTPEWVESWPALVGPASQANLTAEVTINCFDADNVALDSIPLVIGRSVQQMAADINDSVPGISAYVNADGQLLVYLNGEVSYITVSGAPTQIGATGNGTKYYCSALQISPHTSVPKFKATTGVLARPTGSVWIKSTDANLGANYKVYKYNSASASFKQMSALMFKDNVTALAKLDKANGGLQIQAGTTYIKFNDAESATTEATFKLYTRTSTQATVVTTKTITSSAFTNSGSKTFEMAESLAGSDTFGDWKTVSFTGQGAIGAAAIASALPNFVNINVTFTDGVLKFSHKLGGEIKFRDGTGEPLADLFAQSLANLYTAPAGSDAEYVASHWKATDEFAVLTVGNTPPSSTTADGTLWYNAEVSEVDVMINAGTKWVGMKHADSPVYDNNTDANGPIISATKPVKQSDGSSDLVEGDLWVDTSDLENYPKLYKYSNARWALVDTSDQTSENGIVFHDARWGSAGADSAPATIKTLLTEDYVDFDAPDPLLYPEGMLLWNTRRSSFNVKEYKSGYIDPQAYNVRLPGQPSQASYFLDRWVSVAANQENGAGTFGRKAQRAVVVQALQALINSNQAIRDEDSLIYNLLACPGYPEAVNELVNLNYDRALASFIVADTPARLASDATTLSNWGNNTSNATDNNDNGLVTTDPYVAFYYPWGYSSDNLGNNIVVPPSHMMLRTIALSDNVSYPWFAPAGTRRGGITNASAVGYVDAKSGEFQSVALNTGQRDTLAAVHVNPITFISGTGLVAYGQYTRQLAASSLDRVNVARLVVYLRRQFTQLAKPYVFEPNDTITRNEIKQAAESLLLELVGQRAIYDYLVVCDATNNTPARIDRSELYLDVAIEPVKAAEFIYIPLRLENTGAIKGLGQ